MANTKACSNCCEDKPLGEFYVRPNGQPRSLCKRCYNTLCNSRRHKPWLEAEDAEIRANYPKGGYAACKLDRAKKAIQQRAHRIGVAYVPKAGLLRPGSKGTEWHIPADDRDDDIRALDYALMSFRECEPAANLTWILGAVA